MLDFYQCESNSVLINLELGERSRVWSIQLPCVTY